MSAICANTYYLEQYLDNIDKQDKYNEAVDQIFTLKYEEFIALNKRTPTDKEKDEMWEDSEFDLQEKLESDRRNNDLDN
jgi:hypothetical protein